jgi:DNA-binding response OmpR family regulator
VAKILVVDDDQALSRMIQDVLESEGHTVMMVHNGQDGVRLFTREPFDLVMQDVNLPGGVSGYGACQTYKTIRDSVAVLMMTGEFKSEQDEAMARRLGADGFLRKPFSREQLLQEVRQGLEAHAELLGELPVYTCRACGAPFPVQDPLPQEGTLRLTCPNCGQFAEVAKKDLVWEKAEDRTAPQGADARQILVVEDNAAYRQFLAFLLRRAGHVVLEARSGREGLEFAERWKPQLVITDVMLPDVDGLTMAKRIRVMAKAAATPIVFLTAFRASTHEQQAKEMGASYLSKPVRPDTLLSTVNQLLSM